MAMGDRGRRWAGAPAPGQQDPFRVGKDWNPHTPRGQDGVIEEVDEDGVRIIRYTYPDDPEPRRPPLPDPHPRIDGVKDQPMRLRDPGAWPMRIQGLQWCVRHWNGRCPDDPGKTKQLLWRNPGGEWRSAGELYPDGPNPRDLEPVQQQSEAGRASVAARREGNAERNAGIVAEHAEGASVEYLAWEYQLGERQIRRIVGGEAAEEERPGIQVNDKRRFART